MASDNIDLKWEWPAGRKIESRLLVRVESIAPASRGLFGIKASPSMADTLPDATDVVAVVEVGPESLAGRKTTLRLPGVEAKKLGAGTRAAFGLVELNRTCVCVEQVPPLNADEARRWIAAWQCRT